LQVEQIIGQEEEVRLADEPVAEGIIISERRSQDLEGDRPVQALVVRPEHHRHTALTNLLRQQVPSDLRTRHETAWRAGDNVGHHSSRRGELCGQLERDDLGSW